MEYVWSNARRSKKLQVNPHCLRLNGSVYEWCSCFLRENSSHAQTLNEKPEKVELMFHIDINENTHSAERCGQSMGDVGWHGTVPFNNQ